MELTRALTDALDPDALRTWLDSLPPDEQVGLPHDDAFCPLARYLFCRLPEGAPHVSVGEYDVLFDGCYVPLPHWASRFVAGVDLLDRSRFATPAQAIAALDAATAPPPPEPAGDDDVPF